ncbi:ester cyclase [Zavarzinia sp. CC-PAN008]|uniref:ester cyclase n=1 Tax=Zavarzinia sp. CC-PAN008 TaxID=3243332 RepID=UPI003F7497F2
MTTAQAKVRTPREVVDTYIYQLYNKRDLSLVRELIAPETWRHKPGAVDKLNHEQSMKRLSDLLDLCPEIRFDNEVTVCEGDKVVIAWNGWTTQTNGKTYQLAGIEIFRVRDGQIVEIWNSREAAGLWQPSPIEAMERAPT